MFSRVLGASAALAASTILAACSSGGATAAQAPVDPIPAVEPDWDQTASIPVQTSDDMDPASEPDMEPGMEAGAVVHPVAAPAWTGAFGQTSVILARTLRIEGPAGLRDHLVASADDVYEHSIEATSDGLVQIIRRTSTDLPEIRVQVDAWTLAGIERVIIVERDDDCHVSIVATGEAIWRDTNGHLLQGNRLEFHGEIGDEEPFAPPSSDASDDTNTDATDSWTDDQGGEDGQDSPLDATSSSNGRPIRARRASDATAVRSRAGGRSRLHGRLWLYRREVVVHVGRA